MGRAKEDMERKWQAAHDAAARDDRRCIYCNQVIPYGESPGGQDKMCVSCYSAMSKDD